MSKIDRTADAGDSGFYQADHHNPRRLTRPQRTFTLGIIILSLLLTGAAWWASQPIAASCTVESRGISGSREGSATSSVDLRLHLGDGVSQPAHVWQTYASWAEAEAAVDPYNHGDRLPCWYNPLLPAYVSLTPDQLPAAFLFWGILAALFLVGGFGLANLLSIVVTPNTPPAAHLTHRLVEEGGGARPMLWFMGAMVLVLLAVSYALSQVLIALWPLPEDAHFFRVATIVFLGLMLAGSAALLYWIGRYLYRLALRSQTVVELSALPLRPGQTVQLYIAHQPGRLTTTHLAVRLICTETGQKRKQYRASGTASQYTYESKTAFDELIGEQADFSAQQWPGWSSTFSLTVPEAARPSCQTAYPQIFWAVVVRVEVSNGPDFELTFPVQVIGGRVVKANQTEAS